MIFNLKPTILNFSATKFIGKNLIFSYADHRAFELWSSFMPRRKEIQNTIGAGSGKTETMATLS